MGQPVELSEELVDDARAVLSGVMVNRSRSTFESVM